MFVKYAKICVHPLYKCVPPVVDTHVTQHMIWCHSGRALRGYFIINVLGCHRYCTHCTVSVLQMICSECLDVRTRVTAGM